MKKSKELKELLIKAIDPAVVYAKAFDIDEEKLRKREEHIVYCPFHDDEKGDSKSFSFNIKNGKFYCHSGSCNERGKNVVNFYEKYYELSFNDTLKKLYNDYVRPVIKYKDIKSWHSILLDSPMPLRFLKNKRLLSDEVISNRMLGYDGNRITIPVFNKFGLCINVRRYDCSQKAKMLNYKKGYGQSAIYLLNTLQNYNDVIITEGEFDALLLETNGFKAITQTAGSGSWNNEFNSLFTGKTVYICFDNDDAGDRGVELLTSNLKDIARKLLKVSIPINEKGADVTDYFQLGHTPKDFSLLLQNAEVISSNKNLEDDTLEEITKNVSLFEASEAQHYYKKINIKARVSGKEVLPYYLPYKIKITCNNIKDHNCFCNNETDKMKIFTMNIYHKGILKLINVTESSKETALREMFKIPNACNASIEILEQLNAEQLRLTPDVDYTDTGKFVARRAFYIGHGIESNKSYDFDSYSVPDPITQQVVHILTDKKNASDSIDNFTISKSNLDILKKFKPKKSMPEFIEDKFQEIASWQSDHITKIRKRNDLHILTDICYTSLCNFEFNHEVVHKGMLEALVLGDTRCGKGAVVEGLAKYYNLGKVASGENCSYAGLVGGVQPVGRSFMITWGLIPEQDKGIYIIDEASSIAPEDIGRMSRVRSEGVAEITKIITERTWARARAIWISNSRAGKDIENYNNGIDAVQELLCNAEDISRFDIAIIVTKNEVSSKEINSLFKTTMDYDMYNKEDFKNLILWAWSRELEHVKFTPKSINYILEQSIILGRKYSSSIPLIQAENIRIKLAKISAAVAAKCFSTFNSHQGVLVKAGHVEWSINFMESLYNKPNFGYDTYSKSKLSQSTLKDKKAVDNITAGLSGKLEYFIEGMLDQKRISITDISDFTGKDKYDSKELIGELVRLRCLQKENTYYIKKPAFITYLRRLEKG